MDEVWGKVSEWLWVVVLTMGGVVWSMLNARIAKIERAAESVVTREEIERRAKDRDAETERFRNDIKELFARADHLKDFVNSRFDSLKSDMHAEFSKVKDEIRAIK